MISRPTIYNLKPLHLSAITPELVSVVINAEKEKCYVA